MKKMNNYGNSIMIGVLVVGTLAASCIFTGCGKKSVDYNVDGGSSSGDSGGLKNELQIPDACQESLSVGDSELSEITINDPDVTVPDTSQMVIAHLAKKTEITNEEKQRIAETIFDTDKDIYVYDEERTSGDYEEAGDYSGLTFIGTRNGRTYNLTLATKERSLYLDEGTLLKYRPMDGAFRVSVDYYGGLYSTADTYNQCTVTEENARLAAEDFLAKLNVTDVALAKTSDLYWVYTITGGDEVTEADGYVFTFTRGFNGQPVSYVMPNNADNINEQIVDTDYTYERISVFVDENGVLEAYSRLYCDVADTEPATLLTFDEILEKANENVAAYYTEYPTQYKEIEYNDMTLTYFSKSEADGTISYVPAWVLLQYDVVEAATITSDVSTASQPAQMVVLDATDGSVIDLVDMAKAATSFYDPYSDYVTDDTADSSEDAEE